RGWSGGGEGGAGGGGGGGGGGSPRTGFGRPAVPPSRREPRPPARITALMLRAPSWLRHRTGQRRLPGDRLEVAHPAFGLPQRMRPDPRPHALAELAAPGAVRGQPHRNLDILVGRAGAEIAEAGVGQVAEAQALEERRTAERH